MRFNCYLFWGTFFDPFLVAFPALLGRSKIPLGCPLVNFLRIFLPKGVPKWSPKRALERFRCEFHRKTFKMQNQAPAAGRARFSIWTTSQKQHFLHKTGSKTGSKTGPRNGTLFGTLFFMTFGYTSRIKTSSSDLFNEFQKK